MPNTIIENGTITRGYSLEYGKEAISAVNVPLLKTITGTVTVAFTNGRFQENRFYDLLSSGKITLVPYNSLECIGFLINDKTIVCLKTGNEGLSFSRDGMSNYENRLIENNINLVIELEKHSVSHSAIQEYVWRNRIVKLTREASRFTVDFQTTVDESEKVRSVFTNSAAVRYSRNSRVFLRLDGLLNKNSEMSVFINELISHFHTDHVSPSVLETALRDALYNRIIAPYPSLDASKVPAFFMLFEKTGFRDGTQMPSNRILDIAPNGNKLNLETTVFNDFDYTSFNLDRDITIEIFRYHSPRDVNSDCLFYRVTHKNVSYMLFADFDDPLGLEKIMDISEANEQKYFSIMEKKAELSMQLFKAESDKSKNSSQIHSEIKTLNDQLAGLWTIKADIMKWPHHAHKFPNNEKTDAIIRRLNKTVNPRYIIWQPHYTQKGFMEYINRFDFRNKFLSSDDAEIHIISEIKDKKLPLYKTG
ncbi:MAG: hypothetical protein FWH41_06005 [Treponema sp.]|nr:hypothetical protein [Treponema sp.]MCL2139068.1 hypothetical protein [Treponema sp.]